MSGRAWVGPRCEDVSHHHWCTDVANGLCLDYMDVELLMDLFLISWAIISIGLILLCLFLWRENESLRERLFGPKHEVEKKSYQKYPDGLGGYQLKSPELKRPPGPFPPPPRLP